MHNPKTHPQKRELRNAHSSPDLRSLTYKLSQIKRRLNNSKLPPASNPHLPTSPNPTSSPLLQPLHISPKPSPNPEPSTITAYKSQIKQMQKTVTKLLLDFDSNYGNTVRQVEKMVEDGVRTLKRLEEKMKGELLKIKDKQLADAEKLIEGFIQKSAELKKKSKEMRKEKDIEELSKKAEEIRGCLEGKVFAETVQIEKYTEIMKMLNGEETIVEKEPQSTPELCSLRINNQHSPKKHQRTSPRITTEESDRAVVLIKRSRRTNKASPVEGFRSLNKFQKGKHSLGIIDISHHERPSLNSKSPKKYNNRDFMGILQQQKCQYQAMKQQLNLF